MGVRINLLTSNFLLTWFANSVNYLFQMGIEAKLNYRRFLREDENWPALRAQCLYSQDCTCQGCGKKNELNHAHHIFYPKIWRKTMLAHLQTLCGKCHKRIHELTSPGEAKKLHEGWEQFLEAIPIIRKENGLSESESDKLWEVGRKDRKLFYKAVRESPNKKPIHESDWWYESLTSDIDDFVPTDFIFPLICANAS